MSGQAPVILEIHDVHILVMMCKSKGGQSLMVNPGCSLLIVDDGIQLSMSR